MQQSFIQSQKLTRDVNCQFQSRYLISTPCYVDNLIFAVKKVFGSIAKNAITYRVLNLYSNIPSLDDHLKLSIDKHKRQSTDYPYSKSIQLTQPFLVRRFLNFQSIREP